MTSIATIDGSMLEGGGQILRNASALAAITGVPVAVEHIRAKRTRPGLQPQHLTGLRLVEAMCGGALEGGVAGSSRILLRPAAPRPGSYTADTKTAGSCTLMLQASMPVCLFAGPPDAVATAVDGRSGACSSGGGGGGRDGRGGRRQRPEVHGSDRGRSATTQLELRGGTDADMAPPVGYLTDVLLPLLRTLYSDLLEGLDVQLVRRGFYPRGGGVVTASVPALPPATALPPLDLTIRGNLTQVSIKAFTAGRVTASVGKRLAASAESAVQRALKGLGPMGRSVPVLVETAHEPPDRAVGDGCGVLLVADTDTGCRLGASAKGERGVPAEDIGERAAAALAEALASGTCVDQWMQDQLIIWMALGSGTSRMRCAEPTLHTRTAMVVAEQLLPGVKFRLHRPVGPQGTRQEATAATAEPADGGGDGSGLWLIECTGAGWTVGRTLVAKS